MAHVQHHAVVPCDDLTDLPFVAIAKLRPSRMLTKRVEQCFTLIQRQASYISVGAAAEIDCLLAGGRHLAENWVGVADGLDRCDRGSYAGAKLTAGGVGRIVFGGQV